MSGLHVEEVVVEPVLIRSAQEEPQREEHPLARLGARDVVTLDADRIGREPEADRRDAGERRRRVAVGDQAILGVRRVPEVAEGALLELAQERIEEHRLRLEQRSARLGGGDSVSR